MAGTLFFCIFRLSTKLPDMKPLDTLKLPGLLLGIICTTLAYAGDGGCVKGRVTWDETKEPVISATIAFENETALKGFFTHEKGRYYACYIPQGVYTITVSFGAVTITVPNVKINDGSVQELNFALPADIPVLPFSVKPEDQKPAVKRDSTRARPFITASNEAIIGLNNADINNDAFIPVHSVNPNPDKEVSVYVDGYKVTGATHLAVGNIESVKSYNNGIPAKYGDTNGSVVAIETRSPVR